MPTLHVDVPIEQIEAFCRKWKVREFALFGSVLREDFGPDSDVDVLVTFDEDAPWSLLDLVEAQYELEELFGRKVDLVEKKSIRNPFRRHSILTTKQVIYGDTPNRDEGDV
ncbi:MAG: nucleotidyltransferase family protein [Planctomycetales bacterium]